MTRRRLAIPIGQLAWCVLCRRFDTTARPRAIGTLVFKHTVCDACARQLGGN